MSKQEVSELFQRSANLRSSAERTSIPSQRESFLKEAKESENKAYSILNKKPDKREIAIKSIRRQPKVYARKRKELFERVASRLKGRVSYKASSPNNVSYKIQVTQPAPYQSTVFNDTFKEEKRSLFFK